MVETLVFRYSAPQTFMSVSIHKSCKLLSQICNDLDQQPLYPPDVGAIVEESPGVVTQRVVLAQTLGQPVHPLLRPPYGDQAVYPGAGTPLGQAPHEQPALGEANSVITIWRKAELTTRSIR